VAEGVEQEEQARMLRLLRCDQMQGYFFDEPLTFDEMGERLKSRHGWGGNRLEL
jgi:EAL domain-containing protein (putative c-di-GMP-specific phosphodiesterase class I)